ncbi:AI-2E family transporter [Corallincola holothuriorum]|uniref:AI-2E family transporter n=1 Tax=Corallincola holothuriorum TaxID=2282215 RepID=A0A368NNT7_9GAMM|nr:AI-2E family transporter [Corallincola holothuriorum]RCU51533.1 AI-2E family transporter [Corallincola holothuriorum]
MSQTDLQADRQFTKRALEAAIRIAAVFFIASWCYDIIKPFLAPIIWAAIIAVAVKPVSDWIEVKTGLSRKLTATLVTVSLLAALIAPASIVADKITENIQTVSAQVEKGEFDLPNPEEKVKEWPLIGEKVHAAWDDAANNLEGFLKKHDTQVKEAGRVVFSKAAGITVSLLVMVFSIIIAGVFLAGADGSERFVTRLSKRLAGEKGAKFANLASVTVRNVTRGILGVAILQALLAGLGFYLIDLPAAPLLALLVLVMSIIQINPLLLMVPLAIYVFSFASPVVAVIYMIWSIAVGLMDNVLKPLIMGKGSQVPMMVIFLGAVGGFITMGFVGLFVGAVIMVLGYELFSAWLSDNQESSSQATAIEQPAEKE